MRTRTAFDLLPIGLLLSVAAASAETRLTLAEAARLAMANSPEAALARLQRVEAQRTAAVARSELHPNLYVGSGLVYSSGIPQTPGGEAPAVVEVGFVQSLLNPSQRSRLRVAEERASRESELEVARDAVVQRAATAYLEVVRSRDAAELLRGAVASARVALDVTRDRVAEGLELPVAEKRARLVVARIAQRLALAEGSATSSEADLRALLGLAAAEPLVLAPAELAEEGGTIEDVVRAALADSPLVQEAASELRASQMRLDGERQGRLPTVDLVGEYSLLSRFNNYDQFYSHFQRHNVNVGFMVKLPVLGPRAGANVALAQVQRDAAELELVRRRSEVELAVRRLWAKTHEAELSREIAELDLQVSEDNLHAVEARSAEGRATLRDLELARMERAERAVAVLDADRDRLGAHLDLLRAGGQLARTFL
jgi:outer membrane protein